MNSLSKQFHISRPKIRSVLINAGIPPRSSKEQRSLGAFCRYHYQEDRQLDNGSIIFWSKPRVNKNVLVQCGHCGKQRYCQLRACKFKRNFTGLCPLCFNRNMNKDRFADKHPSWKGGKILDKRGYFYIYKSYLSPEEIILFSSMLNNRGYIFEHRLVIARALKRALERSEIVHHLNGIKTDNRLCNLKIVCASTHPGEEQRFVDSLRSEIARLQKLLDDNNISY